jgi:hypothetical protein
MSGGPTTAFEGALFFKKKKVHIFKRHGRRNISSKMGENVRERKQMG